MNDHARILPSRRIALLVDGENLAAGAAEEILEKSCEFGAPDIRRVYGKLDELKARGWETAHGFRLMAASNFKNSADLLLSVEAMELALDHKVDAMVIAASDHDYSHVALKLRERGFPVYGLIEARRACPELRAVYAEVRDIAAPALVPLATPARALAEPAVKKAKLLPDEPQDSTILRLIEQNAEPDGSVALNILGKKLLDAGVRSSAFGASTWSAHFRRHPDLYRLVGECHEMRVFTASVTA